MKQESQRRPVRRGLAVQTAAVLDPIAQAGWAHQRAVGTSQATIGDLFPAGCQQLSCSACFSPSVGIRRCMLLRARSVTASEAAQSASVAWRRRQVGQQRRAGIAARLDQEFVPPVQQLGQRDIVARRRGPVCIDVQYSRSPRVASSRPR